MINIGQKITLEILAEEKMTIQTDILENASIEDLDKLENMISTLYWYVNFRKSKLEEMR